MVNTVSTNEILATRLGVKQFLLRAFMRLASWGLGLVVAARTVPGVSLTATGFIVAIAFFSVTQTSVSYWILRLPHGYASLLLGTTGLALTVAAIDVASLPSRGLKIHGPASWLAVTIAVWLVTTIGAILSFDMYRHNSADTA